MKVWIPIRWFILLRRFHQASIIFYRIVAFPYLINFRKSCSSKRLFHEHAAGLSSPNGCKSVQMCNKVPQKSLNPQIWYDKQDTPFYHSLPLFSTFKWYFWMCAFHLFIILGLEINTVERNVKRLFIFSFFAISCVDDPTPWNKVKPLLFIKEYCLLLLRIDSESWNLFGVWRQALISVITLTQTQRWNLIQMAWRSISRVLTDICENLF